MKKISIFLICQLILVLLIGTTQAAPIWRTDPCGVPPTTYQKWTFDTSANPATPEIDLNEYGDASMSIYVEGDIWGPAGHKTTWNGRDGVWHGDIAQLTITVPNRQETDIYKEIWAEVGFQGLLVDWDILDPVAGVTYLGQAINEDPAQDGWFVLDIGWRIEPNPNTETMYLEFWNSGANIDYVVIDTICIPEPMSILILGLGGLALVRRKRH